MLSSPLISQDRNEFMYKLHRYFCQLPIKLYQVSSGSTLTAYCELLSLTKQAYGSAANAVSDFPVSLYSNGTSTVVRDLREVRDRPDTMLNAQSPGISLIR